MAQWYQRLRTALTSAALIRFIVLIGGLTVYVYLYWTFLKQIWNTPANEAANLDNQDVQIAGAIGGTLAATFAVALGIQRKDPKLNEKQVALGSTILPEAKLFGTLAIWVYFVVGLATLYVTWRRDVQTPQEIKTAATLFAGYVTSIFVAAISGPGQTELADGNGPNDPERVTEATGVTPLPAEVDDRADDDP